MSIYVFIFVYSKLVDLNFEPCSIFSKVDTDRMPPKFELKYCLHPVPDPEILPDPTSKRVVVHCFAGSQIPSAKNLADDTLL